MTETSPNGWPVSADPAAIDIVPLVVGGVEFAPGIRGGEVHDALAYVAEQVHRRVEPANAAYGCWGYSYRENVNSPGSWSNHASGTAIDYNAELHPNGVPTSQTWTPVQIAEIEAILAEVNGVVRWGGHYQGTPDAMHFEIDVTPEELGGFTPPLTSDGPVGSDAFADAPLIRRGEATPAFRISDYTVADDEPDTYGDYTAWWKVVPTEDGLLYLDTYASPGEPYMIDTMLEVFTGTALSDLVQIGIEDDNFSRNDLLEHLVVPVTAGETYYIRVSAYDTGVPTDVVLTTKRGAWGLWHDESGWSGTIHLDGEARWYEMLDEAGGQVGGISVGLPYSWISVQDGYADGLNRFQDVWDRIRGVQDLNQGDDYWGSRNNEWDHPVGPVNVTGSVIAHDRAGANDDPPDYTFRPSGVEVGGNVLHPSFVLQANEVVPGQHEAIAVQRDGLPSWEAEIRVAGQGIQGPYPGEMQFDPTYQEVRAWDLRLNNWEPLPDGTPPYTNWVWEVGKRWPVDFLNGTDTDTVTLSGSEFTLYKQVSVIPEEWYDPAPPSVSLYETWYYARDVGFTITATVTRPRYRFAELLDGVDGEEVEPPTDPPIEVELPLYDMTINGDLEELRRRYT